MSPANGYDALIRVSRVNGREGDSFTSPDVQAEEVQRWAAFARVPILMRHEDLDVSGATMRRPGLEAALRRIEANETRGIVVARIDRLARSVSGGLDVIQRVEAAGGEVVSVAGGIDPTTPAGRMMRRLLLVLAEWELDRVRDHWDTSRARAVRRGVHVSGQVPTGYVRGEDGRLEPDPATAEWVAEAFRMRGRGEPWTAIARFLDEQGVPVRTGAPAWRGKAVQSLVGNPVYLGEARSGKHVNPDAHSPLVTAAEWQAARAVRGRPSPRSANPGLLAGLIRCAGCRYLMFGDRHERRGYTIHSYKCQRHHAPGRCGSPATISGRLIEPHVQDLYLARHGDKEVTISAAPRTADVAEARRKSADAEAALTQYRDDEQIIAAIGKERWLEGLTLRASKADDARRRLEEVEVAAGPPPRRTTVRELWGELSVPERTERLAAAIDAVFVWRGRGAVASRVHVCWLGEGPGPLDLPRRGRLVPLRPFAPETLVPVSGEAPT